MPPIRERNPFLPDDLQEKVTPAARNPAPAQPTPAQSQPPTASAAPVASGANTPGDFEARKQRWKQYLSDPRVQSGLLQFGVAMMTPGVGLGQAIGAGVGAAGRVPQMQAERAQREREAQNTERQLTNEERRTAAYETSANAQAEAAKRGGRLPGDLSDIERLTLDRGMKEKDAFEKLIRDRAQAEHTAAVEAYQNSQMLGEAVGPPPDYNSTLDRVAAEEVMRKRGLYPLYQQLAPEEQQTFLRVAQTRGLEFALDALSKIQTIRQTPVDTNKPST